MGSLAGFGRRARCIITPADIVVDGGDARMDPYIWPAGGSRRGLHAQSTGVQRRTEGYFDSVYDGTEELGHAIK